MNFNIRKWLRIYNRVHALGKMLADSKPTHDDLGNYIAPVAALGKDTQMNLEFEIRELTQRSNRYLDQCGLKMPKPLWHYDRKNPETHISAPEFKYGHLLGEVA